MPTGSRREVLRFGLTAFGSLSLPALYRLRAATAAPRERTALILVWLRGGCSHLDTLDPKPDAPSEYHGPFRPIATRTTGLRVTELLPRLAALSHRFTVLRSMPTPAAGTRPAPSSSCPATPTPRTSSARSPRT